MSDRNNLIQDNSIYIRIIQHFFISYLRFIELKKPIINNCLYMKDIISDLMIHLNNCYDLHLINNEGYTNYNLEL